MKKDVAWHPWNVQLWGLDCHARKKKGENKGTSLHEARQQGIQRGFDACPGRGHGRELGHRVDDVQFLLDGLDGTRVDGFVVKPVPCQGPLDAIAGVLRGAVPVWGGTFRTDGNDGRGLELATCSAREPVFTFPSRNHVPVF